MKHVTPAADQQMGSSQHASATSVGLFDVNLHLLALALHVKRKATAVVVLNF